MRCFTAMADLGFLLFLLTCVPSRAQSADDVPAAAKNSDVKVSLAVPERSQAAKSPLHVIIENTSDKPQQHFEESNSWGYGNLTLQWTDASGKVGTVKKVPGIFTRNVPTTTTLDPGESLVREISFDSELWEGWPEIPQGTTLTLKVTYQSVAEPKASAWSGMVTSKERSVLFR